MPRQRTISWPFAYPKVNTCSPTTSGELAPLPTLTVHPGFAGSHFPSDQPERSSVNPLRFGPRQCGQSSPTSERGNNSASTVASRATNERDMAALGGVVAHATSPGGQWSVVGGQWSEWLSRISLTTDH